MSNIAEYTNQVIMTTVQADGKIILELNDPNGKAEELRAQILNEFLSSGAIGEKVHGEVREKMQSQQKAVTDIAVLLQSYTKLDERGRKTLVSHAKLLLDIMRDSESHA